MDRWFALRAGSPQVTAVYAERYAAARASARRRVAARRARAAGGLDGGAGVVPEPVAPLPVVRRSGRAVLRSSRLDAAVFVLGGAALDAAVDVRAASDRHRSLATRRLVRVTRY